MRKQTEVVSSHGVGGRQVVSTDPGESLILCSLYTWEGEMCVLLSRQEPLSLDSHEAPPLLACADSF